MSLDSHLFSELVGQLVRQGMQGVLVPLVRGIAEHETLITGAHISLGLVGVDGGKDISILGLDVRDDLAVRAVETDSLARVADIGANLTSDLLEVDLLGGHSRLTKEHNL